MERSSPLAAMQPQSVPFGHGHWNYGLDVPTSNPAVGRLGHGQESFNFKDLSMNMVRPDYFSFRRSHGASPTASLAVDLSQNFHIDRSPQPPTPRRSLFTANLFGSVNRRDTLTTPPPPSSSPSPMLESMEVSPLPHKVPFAAHIHVQSPTPEPTTCTDFVMSSPVAVLEPPVEMLKPPPPAERKKPALLRPSLSRTKGFSTTAVTTKPATFQFPCQPFKFGNARDSAPMTLDECFVESPQHGTFSNPLAAPMGPPRPKSASQKSAAFAQPTGSPMAGHARRPCAPHQRPRKQFRRSLSMFEHPADVLNQHRRPDCSLQSIMDVDEAPQPQLPHFVPSEDTIPRITKETMVDVLDGRFGHHYDTSMVIDCRFEYEYRGGHIDGAINFNNKEELAARLFELPSSQRTLLIFHCEYSAHRAPIAAKYIRGEDRASNVHQYPKLTYPEVYILDGGYSSFFQDHKSRCYPQNYVEMNDKEYANACERGLGRIKQQRGKLGRAQTFAFGQHGMDVEESPTAVNRQCSKLMLSMDISLDDSLDASKRVGSRRMASF